MIRIAISEAAFDAIARTLPGSVSFENKTNTQGERYVWLEPSVVDSAAVASRARRELQRRDPAGGRSMGRRRQRKERIKAIAETVINEEGGAELTKKRV